MSSWSTGAFANDQAMDFLEELEELDADERLESIAELFDRAIRFGDRFAGPPVRAVDIPDEYASPDEVVASSALVALALSGEHDLGIGTVPSEARTIVSALTPTRDLALMARDALNLATVTGGFWSMAWVAEEDRNSVTQTVMVLRAALERFALSTD